MFRTKQTYSNGHFAALAELFFWPACSYLELKNFTLQDLQDKSSDVFRSNTSIWKFCLKTSLHFDNWLVASNTISYVVVPYAFPTSVSQF